MKIVLATPLYPPELGSPATYIKELAEQLRDEHEVVIVAYASTSERIPGTTLVTVSKRRPLPIRLVKFFISLYKVAQGADIIYVQNALAAGLPAILVGRLRHIPVVLRFVSDEAWERALREHRTKKQLDAFLAEPQGGWPTKLIMMIQGFVLRRASYVAVPSAFLCSLLVRIYGIDTRRVVVHYPIAEKQIQTPLFGASPSRQIACIGRLVEWKGVDGVIRAVSILAKRFPDVRLVIAGDGSSERRLRELAEREGIAEHVTFLGRISRAERTYLCKTSVVYVLNSTYEGSPQAALIGLAGGTATVATHIPGTDEAIMHEYSGLLVEPKQDEALANAIARIFEDPRLRYRLVEGGRKVLAQKFSWETHLPELRRIFETARAKPRH